MTTRLSLCSHAITQAALKRWAQIFSHWDAPNKLQTSATLFNFVLAMLLFPEAQRAAQHELDRVLGGQRLPEVDDRESLPYVTALMKEIFR